MIESTPSLRVELADGLAIVNLAQPARGNPFGGSFTTEFKQVAAGLGDEPSLRAVLLRADGDNYSFGGDLKLFQPKLDELGALFRQWTADFHLGLQRFLQLPVPVVTAVQGYAMGGGAALLAGCDVVLAGASARIGSAFTHIGLNCDSGASVTFTSRMGMSRARRFVLQGELLSAAEALACGLVDRVVDDGAVQAEALALAQRLAAGPTVAYGEIKRLFAKAGARDLEARLEDEALTLARMAATADVREGINAMTERRRPVFIGR